MCFPGSCFGKILKESHYFLLGLRETFVCLACVSYGRLVDLSRVFYFVGMQIYYCKIVWKLSDHLRVVWINIFCLFIFYWIQQAIWDWTNILLSFLFVQCLPNFLNLFGGSKWYLITCYSIRFLRNRELPQKFAWTTVIQILKELRSWVHIKGQICAFKASEFYRTRWWKRVLNCGYNHVVGSIYHTVVWIAGL